MKIIIGCDHGGFELKERLLLHLRERNHQVNDIGTYGSESVDYPPYAVKVARAVAAGEAERGILICGSGMGMCMTANRIPGIRAALPCEPQGARMSRRHNDSNVLCLGGRFIDEATAIQVLDTWLDEPFDGGRHQKRVDLIDHLTRNLELDTP